MSVLGFIVLILFVVTIVLAVKIRSLERKVAKAIMSRNNS